jgi:hypothetical protein
MPKTSRKEYLMSWGQWVFLVCWAISGGWGRDKDFLAVMDQLDHQREHW